MLHEWQIYLQFLPQHDNSSTISEEYVAFVVCDGLKSILSLIIIHWASNMAVLFQRVTASCGYSGEGEGVSSTRRRTQWYQYIQ